jgi:hypothetical protein
MDSDLKIGIRRRERINSDTRVFMPRIRKISGQAGRLGICAWVLAAVLGTAAGARTAQIVSVRSLLREMADFEILAARPDPSFKQAAATSYSRESHKGGEAWFDNKDAGQYVRTEKTEGRKEHVLADLKGPGAVSRFWSANPDLANTVRFYFDGEAKPRLALSLSALFTGTTPPWGPEFSYISGTGGNLYYPLPFAASLKITIEETDKPVRLYYEIGHRAYAAGTTVETYQPGAAKEWAGDQAETAAKLVHPRPAPAPVDAKHLSGTLTVAPGKTAEFPEVKGENAVFEWSARVLETRESRDWADPRRAHNAWRHLILDVEFDGRAGIRVPLGDFFGSAPGVNPYENLFFTVAADGTMTSRLLMPFKKNMRLRLTNAGRIPYAVELTLLIGRRAFSDGAYHLRVQWGTLTRPSWPFFDTNFLQTSGEGKVVGTVYQIANPALIWWGEGDQKIFVDGEPFPSTFGTGTEDDYGFAYGDNRPFTRPFHAQTRVDGPWSGGHISLNRWYVLDALPYRSGIRFDEEMWHWMPCTPTWTHVVYWYAAPGAPGPAPIDFSTLAPRDLGIREDMLEPLEAEALKHEETGGTAGKERLANCSGAEHLVWRGSQAGDRMTVHFPVSIAGRYSVEINLCMSPEYGRHRFSINGHSAARISDDYSPKLYWQQVHLGVFDLKAGDNGLTVEALDPNPAAKPGNLLGLDYIFLVRN